MDDGVIKFRLHHKIAAPLPLSRVTALIDWRRRARRFGGIGANGSGTGYGNVSLRLPSGFVISGSQTGGLDSVGPDHFAFVTRHDIDLNEVWCTGPVAASSESLTHAALYTSAPDIGGVIHVHSERLWERLKGRAPTTDPDIQYGTPELARAVAELAGTRSSSSGCLVLAGHRNGLLFYGSNLDEAGGLMLDAYRSNGAAAAQGCR